MIISTIYRYARKNKLHNDIQYSLEWNWSLVLLLLTNKLIKKRQNNICFNFKSLGREEVLKEILTINSAKASKENDIPTRIIKENSDIFADFLLSPLNRTIEEGNFPDIFKLADVTPSLRRVLKT